MINKQLLNAEEMAQKLGLDIESPFALDLPCGRIEGRALIKDFGYSKGIVLIGSPEELGELGTRLNDFGYGFACVESTYDLEQWRALCRQWRWTGEGKAPDWY